MKKASCQKIEDIWKIIDSDMSFPDDSVKKC